MSQFAPASVKDSGVVVSDMKSERERMVEAAYDGLTGKDPRFSIARFYTDLTGDTSFSGKYAEGGRLSEAIVAESFTSSTFDQIMADSITRRIIASTRKLGKVSESVLTAQLLKWSKYTVEQVEGGVKIYLAKGYANQGMNEKYLLGIIRNQNPQETKDQGHESPHAVPGTGSALLDDAIRNPKKYRPRE